MAEVHHFEFGPVSPLLAAISAAFGCLLAIILTTRSRRLSGARRARLLTYASVALGVTTLWQPNVLALLGMSVPDSVLRLDPARLAAALAVAVLTAAGALCLLGYARPGWIRMAMAALLTGIGVAGTQALTLASIRVGGQITYQWSLLAVALGLAVAAAGAVLRSVAAPRGLRTAVGDSVGCALAICGVHYAGEYAIGVQIGQSADAAAHGVAGLSTMLVALPTLVFGSAMATMMWFFTVGTATRADLRAIFSRTGEAAEIEPWIIQAIAERVGPASASGTAGQGAPVWRVPVSWLATSGPLPTWQGRMPGTEHPPKSLPPPTTAPGPRAVPAWRSRPAPQPAPNTREQPDATNDKAATVRHSSAVHREPVPEAGAVAAPLSAPPTTSSPAPALPRRRPVYATVAAPPPARDSGPPAEAEPAESATPPQEGPAPGTGAGPAPTPAPPAADNGAQWLNRRRDG